MDPDDLPLEPSSQSGLALAHWILVTKRLIVTAFELLFKKVRRRRGIKRVRLLKRVLKKWRARAEEGQGLIDSRLDAALSSWQ